MGLPVYFEMPGLINRIWRVCLTIMHGCACVVFSITRKHIRGVYVGVWNNGQVLLIRNSYRKGWTFPGGLVAKNEDWDEAAVRETFEEVGVRIKREELVYVEEVCGELGPNDRARMFEVELGGTAPAVRIDEREVVEAEFVSTVEALKRDLNEHVKAYLLERDQRQFTS